jgi:hypothetical protein
MAKWFKGLWFVSMEPCGCEVTLISVLFKEISSRFFYSLELPNVFLRRVQRATYS